jgi:hypothetical protein
MPLSASAEIRCCFGEFAHLLLNVNEPPELARVEVIEVGRRTFKQIRDW